MRWSSTSSRRPAARRELGGCGAVDEHVLLARCALGLGHRALQVVRVGDQWPLAHVDAGRLAAEDPDRHAVVVVTAPAVRRLEGPPSGDDGAGSHDLVE
jgi:hypothetical protein